LYEGTNVIEFRYGAGAPSGSFSGGMQVAITGATATNYLNVLSDLTASSSNTTLFSTTNAWPGTGTILTFSPPAPCTPPPAPGNTVASISSGCSGFSSALSLQNSTSGSGVSYQWQSSPNGVDTWTNVGTNSATYTTSPLTTTTWFQCLVTCSTGPSTVNSTPVQLTVAEPAVTYFTYAGVQYNEAFATWGNRCSTGDVPSLASNHWKNTPTFGAGTWRASNTTQAAAGWNNTSGGFFSTTVASNPDAVAVTLPAARFHSREGGSVVGTLDFHVNMSAGTGNEFLRFEYINSVGNGNLGVWVSTNGGTSFTQVGSTLTTTAINTWVTQQFTIGSTSATTVIRLRGTAGAAASGNDIGVDNFRIIPAPTCAAPTSPAASVIGAGAADISWTCASCTGSYYVEYGPSGFTLGTGTIAGPFTNSPASITGLANGNYQAYVRQDCGVAGISSNAGPANFSIVGGDFCSAPINLDVLANTDWSLVASSTNASNDISSSACHASLPGRDVVLYHDVEAGATLSLGLWSSANRITVAYDGACPGSTSLACSQGGYYDLGSNVQMVNDYQTLVWTNNGCTTVRLYALADAITTGGDVYIFNYGYTPASGTVCAPVTGIVASTANTGSSAQLSWSPTCSGNAIVEFGPAGFLPGTGANAGAGVAVAVNGTSTTLNGLDKDVTYDVYVRNDCGADQFSTNGTPIQFTIINGDDCSRVIDLSSEANMFNGTTAGAANDLSVHACGTFAGGDLYLSHPVGAGATITFFAAHDYAAVVSVSYGNSCPGASPLTCEEDLAEFIWTNTTGSTQNIYWIQDGSSEGGFTLEWIYSDPCALDSDADGINDCEDSCIELPGENGDPCYAGPLFTSGEIVNCACVGSGAVPCSNDLTLEFQTDGNPFETSWELIEQGTNFVVQSGGSLNAPSGVETNFTCLPDGCFFLRVYDSAGDGMTTGGYIFRTLGTNQRIIDNRNNFSTGSVSAISGGQGFCLPLSNDKVVFTSCDKLDWINGQFVVASPNAAVSAEWIVGGANSVQDANSGYEFWIFDPNGSYSFRRFRSHNVSDGFGPASATRACHMKLNNWVLASQVPANTLMNVRVRARINGVNGEFGPACRLEINPALAACPQTNLMDIPGNQYYSCGSTRQWGTGNYVHARPVSGANRYQFRFRIAAEGFEVVRTATTYFVQLNWSAVSGPQLQDGKTYDVDVRVSKDGGLTWCTSADPWGNICQLTIDNTPANSGNQNFAAEGGAAELVLFPNPNRGDVLNFSLSAIEEGVNTVSVDIYDLTGKRMSARTIAVSGGNVNTTLDLNGELAAGMYLVNITAGGETYTERLVIQP
jgi:hypothetical protein